MTDETTTEQLAEIDRDMADIERQVAELVEEAQQADYKTQELPEYTPPEGWRVLAVGEALRDGDERVQTDESRYATRQVGRSVQAHERYIRRIEPQPQPEPEPEPVQVREGRWRTRGGSIRNVTPTPQDHESFPAAYVWWDGFDTWRNDGRWWAAQETTSDLVEYLGPIEPDKTQELPETGEESPDQLIGRISLLRQRVTQLEDLVGSLRTINEAQEKAFTAANKDNTALRNQLAAVKAELATKAETSRRLQMELDAAQQVPADSPELRQLRADLEQATLGRDTYRDGYDRVLSDLVTTRKTAKAEAVEAIVEWLQAFRGCNSPALALLLLEALPAIMRSLTGLEDEEIE